MSEKEAKNYTQIWAICLVLLTQRQRCMRLYILDGWMDVFVCTCIFFHFVRCYCCYCRCFIYLGKKLKFNYIILLHAHTNWIMNETRKNKCVCMCAEERKKKQLKKKNELCASDVYDSGFCLFWGHTHTYEKNIYTLSTMALLLLWFFFLIRYIIAMSYMRHFWIFGFQKFNQKTNHRRKSSGKKVYSNNDKFGY